MANSASALMLGALPLILSTPSIAQSADTSASDGALDEIIVTARKRSESLQDVPVAVAAITRNELTNNLATDLNKIAELAPQVMIGRAVTGTGSVITIRGISSASVDSGLEQSVSLAIDGVSLSRGRIVQAAMFDMQQIEIMQGPQALFFGKNSPAGVISITTADPTDQFEASVRAGYEFVANERYAEGIISGPLTDALKARVGVRYSKMDGWIKNDAVPIANPFQPAVPLPGARQGATSPKGRNISGRLTFVLEPTDNFSAKLKATYSNEHLNGNAAFEETYCIGGQTVPTILEVPQPNSDCAKNGRMAQGSFPTEYSINFPFGNDGVPYEKSAIGLVSLTLDKTFDNFSIASTSGYYDQDHKGSFNGDRSEFVLIYASEHEHYWLFNQEVRLNTTFDGSVNLMVGGYYEHSRRKFLNAPSVFPSLDPVANNYVSLVTTSDSTSNSYSVFGQVRWKIIPDLELSAGARYSHDDKSSALRNLQANPTSILGRGALPVGQVINAKYKDDNVSPDVTLAWKPQAGHMVYAAYKTGYKSGGIASPPTLPATTTSSTVLFGPEKVRGFEAGYKGSLLDDKLRFDLVAYTYNYDGLQVTVYDSVAISTILRNAARARTTGLTGSLVWKADRSLTITGNLGYNRARYVSFRDAPCYAGQTAATGCFPGSGGVNAQDLSGKALNRAPKVTFKLGADYDAELGNDWRANLSASASYSASYKAQADDAPGGRQDAYWLVNAAIHLHAPDDRYRLSLVGRNLTNSRYLIITGTQSFGQTTQYQGVFNRPREVALEAGINF